MQAHKDILASEKTGKPIPVNETTDVLIDTLGRLYALDGSIRKLGAGTGDGELKTAACRGRAMAWLHGWAVFSRLVMEASATPAGEMHQRLIVLEPTKTPSSALGMLLAIYKQMQQLTNVAEPLQTLLSDDTDFVFLLSYKESWKGDKPNSILHSYFIPSADDIIGKPSDAPTLRRHILSLWGLVNLQLDTWQAFDYELVRSDGGTPPKSNSLTRVQADGSVAWLRANKLELGPLLKWLDALQHTDDLGIFDERAQFLETRLHKIQLFLESRQDLSDADKLKAVLHGLSDSRLHNEDPRSVIGQLIVAAAPLSISGHDETLYDAAIWLRYLMLASYQNEGSLALGNAANSLESIWSTYNLPGKFALDPQVGTKTDTLVFLRWNTWPAEGSLSTLLSRLTSAAYEYLRFEQGHWDREKIRASSVHNPTDMKNYSEWLAKDVSQLSQQGESVLLPYFSSKQGNQSKLKSTPAALAGLDGPSVLSFRGTASMAEQSRLIYETWMIYTQIKDEVGTNQQILDAYLTGDPNALAASLWPLTGLSPLSNRHLYRLPNYPFARYAEQLREASKSLKNVSDQMSAEQDLRGIFRERQIDYQRTRNAFEAARLGVRVSQQANTISETFTKIAQLDLQAERLEKAIAELKYKGSLSDQKAKALALEYSIQQRDLAAAKVEALLAASEQASDLVKQASTELEGLKQRLLSTSATIHEKKEEERNRSFINGVVNIVGLALAPFTSGASLQIATQVNQAINLIDQIKHTDWSNFDNAVATINNVGAFAAQTIDLAEKIGGPDVAKGLGGVKTFLASANDSIKSYSEQAQQMYRRIQALTQKQDIARFASAIASGIPISYDEEKHTIRIALDAKQLVPVDATLQSKIGALLDAGAMMVNDARVRGQQLAALPGLTGEELKKGIKDAVDLTFRAMPPDLLQAPDVAKAQQLINNAKQDLETSIDQISDAEAKMLAEALASGAIFVKSETGKVVAIQASTGPEIKAFQARLKSYQTAVSKSAVTDIITSIQSTSNDINSKAQQMVQAQDDEGLAKYANETLPRKIDALRDQLATMATKVDEARGQLEDNKKQVSIASYGSEAADFYSAAAKIGVDEINLRTQRAELAKEAAFSDLERAKLVKSQQDKLSKAEAMAIEIAAASLRRTYFECLARGFDPLDTAKAPFRDDAGAREHAEGLTLFGVTFGSIQNKSDKERLLLQNQADAVAGMVQWINLLELTPSSESPGGAAAASDPVAYRLSLYSRLTELERKSDSAKIEELGEELKSFFDDKAGEAIGVVDAKAEHVGKADAIWFDNMTAGESQYWLNFVTDPVLRKHLLGVVRLDFSVNNGRYSKLVYRPPDPKQDYAYYMSPQDAVVSQEDTGLETSQLTFVILAPEESFVSRDDAIAGGLGEKTETARQFSSLDEAQWLKGIQSNLTKWKQLGLSGAIGRWTILLAASADFSPEERRMVQEQIRVTIRLPFFRVSHKH
jgi:polyhydroxyalkanoate synthesis regulator phasin